MNPRWLVWITLLWASLATSRSETEHLRVGEASPCFLKSYGKGPDGFTEIKHDFRLRLLNTMRPEVGDGSGTGDPNPLRWLNERQTYQKVELFRVHGRRVIRLNFAGDQGILPSAVVLIAMETEANSEWYRPFFVAVPETLEAFAVVSRDTAAGLIVTLHISGTGAFRTHYLFDLAGNNPKCVSSFSGGRVARNEFDSDKAYRKALKIFEVEKRFLSGLRVDQDSAQ